MMAVTAFLIFATALVASCWTIWATIAPQARRIVDLLTVGPERSATAAQAVMPTRASLRVVSGRPALAPVRMRAAA
jgi:hypothetical protein